MGQPASRRVAQDCWGSAGAGACFTKTDGKFWPVWHYAAESKASNYCFYMGMKKNENKRERSEQPERKYEVREGWILEEIV